MNNIELATLFEIYKELLTERQREQFLSHYCFDLSLSEIAEPEGNTRQSVYAAVKKVKEKLDEYERILGIKKTNENLKRIADRLKKDNPMVAQEIFDIIGE